MAAQSLRSALALAHREYNEKHTALLQQLEGSEPWTKLSGAQRSAILNEEGISTVPNLETGSEEKLVQILQQTPFGWWDDKTAALPARFQNALAKAAKLIAQAQSDTKPNRPSS